MHLCKHIFHHCLPHPRGNTNLGQVGSVGTWCPRRGLDVLYVRSLSMTCFAVFFGFQSKLKKDIHIIAKFSVSFFLTLCQHFWLNKSIIYFEYCQWESNWNIFHIWNSHLYSQLYPYIGIFLFIQYDFNLKRLFHDDCSYYQVKT